MALVDVDSWTTEYESCTRLNRTLLSQLQQRDGKITDSPDYNRLTLSIQMGFKQFDREMQQLKLKLNDASSSQTITLKESEKRQQQLETLQLLRQQLQAKFTNTTGSDREALFGNASGSRNKSTTSDAAATSAGNETSEESDAAPLIDSNNVQRLQQYKDDMMEDQNRSLETLSKTLSRQRAITLQFGQEIEEQNGILDNLATTIDRVEEGVSRETHNVTLVNRRDSTCGYWIVILVLFIAIVIVSLL